MKGPDHLWNLLRRIADPILGPPSAASGGGHADLEVQVVTTTAGLLALEPEWNRLVELAGVAHPFLTHEWVRTWWECFAAGQELRVLVVRRGGECAGIAPFMLAPTRMYGLPVRRLELLANVHTPRTDLLIAEPGEPVYRALWRHLHETRSEWDVLMLPQLDERSPTLASAALQHELRVGSWAAQAAPFVDLTGSRDEYFARLAPKCRANLRNRERRLAGMGEGGVEVVRGDPGLADALADGFRIEAAAWKGTNGTAIQSEPDVLRFYRRMAEVAAARGWLELWFLTANRRRVAFGYALRYRATLFLLKQGYDPEYRAASPFMLLCRRIIDDCFARGTRVLDFLGCEEDWKQVWNTTSRGHRWLIGFSPSLRARAVHAIKFGVVPTLRDGALGDLIRPAASDGKGHHNRP